MSQETMSRLSDEELVKRCREGGAEAWSELVTRFSRYVQAICSRGFGLSAQDAEDAFQDVFTRVYSRLGTLRNDSAVRPWIAQTTRRVCLDRLAGAGREEPLEDFEDARVDETLDEIDAAFTVREALEQLGEPCHDLLDRFFARDESYRTISEALDLPPGTVASRISRCLGKLREEIEGRKSGHLPSGEQ